MSDSNRYEELSNEELRGVHAACEAFERALQNEQPIRIEDCLATVTEEARGLVFRELLAIELERQLPGRGLPKITDYQDRFPNRHDDIRQVFHDVTGERPVDEQPQTIGRYRIEKVLGKGTFGIVYLAHDTQLERTIAIKIPHPKLISKPEDAAAYLAEARIVASLDHPGIVPVYDVGSTADYPCYVVSRYIDGSDLATRLSQNRWTYTEAAELVATVADALHYAHKQGLTHRDVKPGNILIGKDDQPYVVDFGLALREENVGKGPKFAGTPAYMSPEQARGEGHRVDGRSDIFSLGVVLYELLAGRRPFRGETVAEVVEQIRRHDPRPLRQYDEKLPKELERICHKSMSRRASERYSSAHDFAEDLRLFLADQTVILNSTTQGGVPAAAAESPASVPASTQTGSSTSMGSGSSSDSQPLRIVPRGLRSFDAHDADFFLELLPGPRDREGLPDSLRFWKTRIEETDPDKAFSVGVIYGPSGCGKSSLVKAGLLPLLSEDVISVYIEATPEETELRLLRGLHKGCPTLDDQLNLKDTVAALRTGQGIPVGRKVLLVLDQFEQWLHARQAEESSELVQALRQCDGSRVQCIVMVRDDFWLAVSRFMRELEVRLVEGQNSALADLFDPDHARKVLAAFGRAFGKLPANSGETTRHQKAFLKQAASGLAREGKVICVRLALFAEMMKGKAWTPATLKEVGGTEGIGVTFLEETFSAKTAPPEHRYHQSAARAVLKALLPESGTDIKGHMRSNAELLEVSGYVSRPKDFDDLIRILDSEIRLITPTDPEGQHEGERQGVSPPSNLASSSATYPRSAPPAPRYYQLTHDYLVPSLRDWLTRKQKETRRGRAELLLADRAALWTARPEHRQLPSLWQWIRIKSFTEKKNWTPPQRQMMRKATRHQTTRGLLMAGCLILLGGIGWEGSGRLKAQTLRDRLLESSTDDVAVIVNEMAGYRRWVDPLLKKANARASADGDSRRQLHTSLALLPMDSGQTEYLYGRLLQAEPQELSVVREALLDHRDELTERLWTLLENPDSDQNQRFRAACALSVFADDDPRWEKISRDVAAILVIQKPFMLEHWTEALKGVGRWLLPPLADFLVDENFTVPERGLMATVYGTYAADTPEAFVALEQQLVTSSAPVIPEPAEATATPEPGLDPPLKSEHWPDAAEEAKVARDRKKASLGMALVVMGRGEKVWPLLQFTSDPTVRSLLIDRFAASGAEPGMLIEEFEQLAGQAESASGANDTVSIQRALLQSLGKFDLGQTSRAQRRVQIPQLVNIFRDHPDAGLHATAEWLLRQWSADQDIEEIERPLRTGKVEGNRRWYIAASGQTMSIIDKPGITGMGNDQPFSRRHKRRIDRSYALATSEVTVAQIHAFRQDFQNDERYTPTPDCPINSVSWYDAADYCNWLSKEEGIAEDQWCFETNMEGKAGETLKLAPDYLQRTGYRLPTEAEWEHACRAQSLTLWSWGDAEDVLPNYAVFAKTTRPAGQLLPNDFGLFNMHGNLWEWCADKYQEYPQAEEQDFVEDSDEVLNSVTPTFKLSGVTKIIRGGSFTDGVGTYAESTFRGGGGATEQHGSYGFRVARTVRPSGSK